MNESQLGATTNSKNGFTFELGDAARVFWACTREPAVQVSKAINNDETGLIVSIREQGNRVTDLEV